MRLSFADFAFTMQATDKDTGLKYTVRINGSNQDGLTMTTTPVDVEELSSDEEEAAPSTAGAPDAEHNASVDSVDSVPPVCRTTNSAAVLDLTGGSASSSSGSNISDPGFGFDNNTTEDSIDTADFNAVEFVVSERYDGNGNPINQSVDLGNPSDTSSEYESAVAFSQEAVLAKPRYPTRNRNRNRRN